MWNESVVRGAPAVHYEAFRKETSMQGFLKVEGLSKAFAPANQSSLT